MPHPAPHVEMNSHLTDRRLFLAGAAAVPLTMMAWGQVAGQEKQPDGMIELVREPLNLEFPFHTLDSFIVPNDRFYVRSHFAQPKLEVHAWRLRVEGAVTRPLELTYDQLRGLPMRTVTATLECAGNSRLLNVPPLKGVGWKLGGVGNAEWTGVPLAAVLERAGLKPNAVEVILEGADRGEVTADFRPAGPISYARSLPLTKARQEEVLLALKMNGTELPPAHGFPVRAIVPGWYGMASVKWLTRLIVTEVPFQGFWQTSDYSYFDRSGGLPVLRPLTEMQIKSLIARPRGGELVRAGTTYRVFGAAWTGDAEITRVEVSTDNGTTAEAQLQGRGQRFAWRLWEYAWRVPANAGPVTLRSRATDSRGRSQPTTRDPDRRNYMINHLVPIEVRVG